MRKAWRGTALQVLDGLLVGAGIVERADVPEPTMVHVMDALPIIGDVGDGTFENEVVGGKNGEGGFSIDETAVF